jgi:hypothetical protein
LSQPPNSGQVIALPRRSAKRQELTHALQQKPSSVSLITGVPFQNICIAAIFDRS